MENIDDIIKRMVLHMKYDRNKTLSENKILLEKKECVPLDATPYVDSNGERNTGDIRFKDYPQLGTIGDGKCRCWDNKKCLEFKESCCGKKKTATASIEPLQRVETKPPENFNDSGESYIKTIDLAGREFYLPPETTNIVYWDINKLKIQTYMYSISGIDSQTPRVRRYCESQTPKKSLYDFQSQAEKLVDTGEEPTDQLAQQQEDFKIRVEECMLKAVNILLKSLTQGGVSNFTYNGINYGWCFKNGDEDVYNMYWNGGYYGGEKVLGADGEDDCPGTMWKNITPKEVEEKVAKGEVKVRSTQNVITTNKETEGTASEAGLYSPNTTTPELFQKTEKETITSDTEKIILPLNKSKSWIEK